MALVPEYLFPARPARLVGKDGDLLIGLDVFTQPDAGAQYDKRISFLDILDVNLLYYGERDIGVDLFTFDNDLVLRLEARADGAIRLVLTYNGQVVNVPGAWSYAYGYPINTIYRSGYLDLDQCKLAVCAEFTDPVENITPCRALSFHLFMPSYRIIDEYGTRLENTLDQTVVKGLTKWWNGEINQVEMDNAYFPVVCGSLDYQNTEVNYWEITDLAGFSENMKSAGSGTTKNVWDDTPEQPDDDTSGPGGGGGNYDPTSDPVDFPSLPTGGALTSGMIKGFVIGQAALVSLQQKLWDMSIFDISTQFQKLVNQPLDCLISLHAIPCLPATGQQEEIKLGSFPTQVSALRITNQYLEIDGGSLKVPLYWGSALDYAPYSRAELFIPFVGFRNIQIEDIQGLTLNLKYHVDVLTGDCVAYLKCGNSVLYSWTGNCLTHIPCTASSNDRLAKTIGAVGSIGVGLVTGNPAAAAGGVISSASNVVTSKNHVQRSGDVAGSPGIMSEFNAYMVYHRPKQSLAKDYNKFKGYPSNITYVLSNLTGYTEVEHVHLTGIKATDTELQEIENLLKSGVII